MPTCVSLDNEPELWNSTHLEVQGPTAIDPDTYITKTINLATALKAQFPAAVIFGPAHYGFNGFYSWQGALKPAAGGAGADWFTDKYLLALKSASATSGKPLVDVYDLHWYPEVYDASAPTGSGLRITSMGDASLNDTEVELIVQAPRDLWDPTFHDPNNANPWVYNALGMTPIRMLPRLQAKIAAAYPTTKLSISEYGGGGWNHIAGTIAEADMLGIFGAQGLFAASLWPPAGSYPYTLAGFRVFRGFDGANANFGDTSLQATSSDVSKVAVYASTDSQSPGRVVFVAINRSSASHTVALNGQTLSGTASAYQITAVSASNQTSIHPVMVSATPASGTSMTIALPAMSVTTIDVR
jgi:hypothetical protein